VHDEVILELAPGTDLQLIYRLFAQSPSWAPDLPVRCEGVITPHYCKP
jgi:hypothetical protein